jgi:hypothetical protein
VAEQLSEVASTKGISRPSPMCPGDDMAPARRGSFPEPSHHVDMDALRTQVVFDAAEPHALAAFWAEALHYEHEEIDAFVRGLVDAGQVPVAYTVEIDGKRCWRSVASLRHPDDPVDGRGAGTGRRILFQAVPEAKTVKNRVHLDLLVGPEAHGAEVERLVGLGASVVGVHDGDEGRWTLLADPEGNEFDVS